MNKTTTKVVLCLILTVCVADSLFTQSVEHKILKSETHPSSYVPKDLEFLMSLGADSSELYYLTTDYPDKYLTRLENQIANGDSIKHYREFGNIIYFGKTGRMLSFNSVTLVTPTFMDTYFFSNWNETGMYNTFPPTDIYSAPMNKTMIYKKKPDDYDKLSCVKYLPKFDINRDSLHKYIHPYYNTSNSKDESYDYEVFIIGIMFLCEEGIEYQVNTVKKNIELDSNRSKIKINYVVADSVLMRKK